MQSEQLSAYLNQALSEILLPELPQHYRGKVRDNYDLPNGTRIIVASDRISAFDIILASIPLKGQVLTQTARFWFDTTRDICPNHVIDYPDPNVVVARHVKIMPVEIIVRDYLAGSTGTSILPMYKKGQRNLYGIQLPDGLRDNEKLPQTIITPTTKAGHDQHDEPLTAETIVAKGLLTAAQWDQVCDYALALFARGREMAAARGLILADTKYEFGFTPDGTMILADEIHTPDSSRYWQQDTYAQHFANGTKPDSFDKDFVRNWVVSRCDPYKDPIPTIPAEHILKTMQVYIHAFETITGQKFELPDPAELPMERIRKNLARYF